MAEQKQRLEVYFTAGMSIERAYDCMKEVEANWNGKFEIFGSFNEKEINSNMSLNECYKTITGITKTEFEKKMQEDHEKYLKHKEEHTKRVPALCAEYLATAKETGLVDKDKLEAFERCLPTQVDSVYEGYQITSMFEINKILVENQNDPDKAIRLAAETFENQGHSGFSASIVASLVREYSPVLGSLFYKKVYEPYGIY